MWGRGRKSLCGLAVGLALLLPGSTAARAGTASTVGEGGGLTITIDPAAHGALAAWLGLAAPAKPLPVMVRALEARGRPTAAAVQIGAAIPDGGWAGGQIVAVAPDVHRRDYLVVWSGWEPGLPEHACERPPPPAGPVALPPAGPCHVYHAEIFTRLVGGDGHPLGPARRITTTPSLVNPYGAVGPTLVADPRGHGFLVAYTARPSSDSRSELDARRVDERGVERGRAFRVATGAPASTNPVAQLVPRGRGGYLLAFTAGIGTHARLYTQPLDRRGRAVSGARLMSQASGPGVEGFTLVVNSRLHEGLLLFARAIPGSTEAPFVRRCDGDGRPRGHLRRLHHPAGGSAAVAADGDRWRYAWVAGDPASTSEVFTQLVDANGRLLGTPTRLPSSHEHAAVALVAAADGAPPIVGWTDLPWSDGPGTPVSPALVRTATP